MRTRWDELLQRQVPVDEGPLYVDPSTGFPEQMPSRFSGAVPPPEAPTFRREQRQSAPAVSVPPVTAPAVAPPEPAAPAPRIPDPATMPVGDGELYKKYISTTIPKAAGKDELEERKRLSAARADEQAAVTEAGAAKKRQAESEAEGTERKVKIGEQYGQRRDALTAEHDRAIAEADARATSDLNRWRSAKPTEFWSTKDTGDKVMIGIGIALSGLGAAIQKSAGINAESRALDIIDRAIQGHDAKERERIGKMRDEFELSKGRVMDMRTRKADALRDLDAWKAAAYEQAANEASAKYQRAGVPLEEAETKKLVAGLRAKSAQEQAEYLERERAKAVTTVSKTVMDPKFLEASARVQGKITGEQAEAAARIASMVDAYRRIVEGQPLTADDVERMKRAQLVEKAASKSPIGEMVGRAAGVVQNPIATLPPAKQATAYAYQDAQEHVMRALTGAGATEAEAERTARSIVPQPGDAPQTVREKQEKFRRFIEAQAMRANPQQVAPLLEQVHQPAQAPPAAAQGPRRGRVNGKPALIYPDGTYELEK